ncbi:uncharacterized protein [Palaemon carinicauda]|uniref:uncharacterized protein n=1 Tax=Palaemon carinicauda TaxID=392227 RepID=UPI0035B5DCD0
MKAPFVMSRFKKYWKKIPSTIISNEINSAVSNGRKKDLEFSAYCTSRPTANYSPMVLVRLHLGYEKLAFLSLQDPVYDSHPRNCRRDNVHCYALFGELQIYANENAEIFLLVHTIYFITQQSRIFT